MSQEKHSNVEIDSKQLDQLITNAIRKVGAKKENDICRYLPGNKGGYIHHFTMRKMRHESPQQLATLITKHIINSSSPTSLPPRQRAPRGSRKQKDQYVFSKTDLERLRNMARLSGDKEMIRKLTPRKDLRTIKRELISSIRHGNVDRDLWESYVETVNSIALANTPNTAMAG